MVKVEKPASKGRNNRLVPSRSGSTHNVAANVKVVVRVRPPNQRELEANNRIVVDVVDENMLVFDPKEEQRPFFYQGVQQPNRSFLKRANKELKFVFDHVCNQDATNRYVFEMTTKEILAALMDGYNCSVFVYGATGAGKTFTMIGNLENPGITYLTMEHLFYSIDSFEKDREFEIGVSYLEVYNENVFDLLKRTTPKTALQLREDSKYGVMVVGLSVHNIKTAQDLLDMLDSGNKNRTQHPTDANAESSRSHAVFQVYITMRNRTTGQVQMVKLSMIDLAGSERAAATTGLGDRFKEGANINRSLLSLGNCINKLADGSNYIPYRDSKLTRLLKDSLGGNCKTVMIANVSPSSMSYEDTYNTLKYAARANKIQLNIKKNIVNGDLRTSQYVKLNEELKNKIKELEAKLALSVVPTAREQELANDKVKQDWRRRITEEEKSHGDIESQLLSLMSRQRVLALRHRLKTRAFSRIVDLAHRSSTEAMEQMCTEDIPRHERASESYLRQSVSLDSKISVAWTKWSESKKKLANLTEKALKECPDLDDFISNVQLKCQMRELEARGDLVNKVVSIQDEEINAFARYMSEMPSMLKKLYLTLKGYDLAPPELTEEYLNIMKKAKPSKGISWSDKKEHDEATEHLNFITTLDLQKPSRIPEFNIQKPEANATVDIITDSDELTDIENKDPEITLKRRGTPIKLANNETIIIDDSFDNLDMKTVSAKKIKIEKENGVMNGVENYGTIDPKEITMDNYGAIDPKDLNSTFVLAGKLEAKKQLVRQESVQPVAKKGLYDRTNTMSRSVTFGENRAKIVKPVVVGNATAFRRPATAMTSSAVTSSAGAKPATRPGAKPGFGSSLTRDGTPIQRNIQDSGRRVNITEKSVGFKAVRARERVQNHPYSRPTAFKR